MIKDLGADEGFFEYLLSSPALSSIPLIILDVDYRGIQHKR